MWPDPFNKRALIRGRRVPSDTMSVFIPMRCRATIPAVREHLRSAFSSLHASLVDHVIAHFRREHVGVAECSLDQAREIPQDRSSIGSAGAVAANSVRRPWRRCAGSFALVERLDRERDDEFGFAERSSSSAAVFDAFPLLGRGPDVPLQPLCHSHLPRLGQFHGPYRTGSCRIFGCCGYRPTHLWVAGITRAYVWAQGRPLSLRIPFMSVEIVRRCRGPSRYEVYESPTYSRAVRLSDASAGGRGASTSGTMVEMKSRFSSTSSPRPALSMSRAMAWAANIADRRSWISCSVRGHSPWSSASIASSTTSRAPRSPAPPPPFRSASIARA